MFLSSINLSSRSLWRGFFIMRIFISCQVIFLFLLSGFITFTMRKGFFSRAYISLKPFLDYLQEGLFLFSTSYLMNTPDIHLDPLTIDSPWATDRIDILTQKIYQRREQDLHFGHYLLEPKPPTHHQLTHDLVAALEDQPLHHALYIIHSDTQQNVWYILLKHYSDVIVDDPVHHSSSLDNSSCPNVEASYRTLTPGMCAKSLRAALHDYWQKHPDIQSVLWHHAIDNTASGMVFHHNGFAWLRYHHQYVHLPNIPQQSDTIMRILNKEDYFHNISRYPEYHLLKEAMKRRWIHPYTNNHPSYKKIVHRYCSSLPPSSSDFLSSSPLSWNLCWMASRFFPETDSDPQPWSSA